MEMDNYKCRSILLKLQDRLSDDDRKRLHFFLGNDVPRRIRDDPSLTGTLSLIESLFDQDKISEQDFTFLIKTFEEIQCKDAAHLLRNYMGGHIEQGTPSLTSILPKTNNSILLENTQEDKFNFVNQYSNPMPPISEFKKLSQPVVPPVPKNKEKSRFSVSKLSRTIMKYSPIVTLISLIALSILIGLFVEQNGRLTKLSNELSINDFLMREFLTNSSVSEEKIKNLQSLLMEKERDKNNSLILVGKKYGGDGGSPFDDSLVQNFSCSFYIRGLISSKNSLGMDWIQFLYSPSYDPKTIIESTVIGTRGDNEQEHRFLLDPDERVIKIHIKYHSESLYVNGILRSVPLVRGVQLFTSKNRISRLINDNEGEILMEQYDGYTLGYARGRRGLRIDQLQFLWYRVPSP